MEVFGRRSWRLPSTLWSYITKAPVLALLTEYAPSDADSLETSEAQVGICHLFFNVMSFYYNAASQQRVFLRERKFLKKLWDCVGGGNLVLSTG